MPQNRIKATLMRGGTSKGVFVQESDLPAAPTGRDEFILELFGSPDPIQIDGLGGSHSHTSKLIAVSKSARAGCDIDYLFAQVGTDKPIVDYRGNCGNLTAAVAPYAIDEGLVNAEDGVQVVTLFNKNTERIIRAQVSVRDGTCEVEGNFLLPGVLRSGAEIVTEYLDPAGSVFNSLYPLGNPIDTLSVAGLGQIEVSLVDVTSPYLFIRASDLGLSGNEMPTKVNSDPVLLARLEMIRGACAQALNLVTMPADAARVSPAIPRLILCAPPNAYHSSTGHLISEEEIDILARAMSMQKMHHAYPITGALCTAAAVLLPGTIPNELARNTDDNTLRIGQPKGISRSKANVEQNGKKTFVRSVSTSLTARRLMSGEAYYRSLLPIYH